ncbi:unnamed protein product [Caenorhabditis angaria]|uniref:Small ribosomal subunit protein mS39 n=1 Tax=Caenorhabditis angaria TaxID=860376 RepID=A0A9P1MVA2_9PELO|nr:unnamed protein product [Caenorhabditis angaria]
MENGRKRRILQSKVMIGRLGLSRAAVRGFASAEPAKFTVQPAIERAPTDLLKALSETVGTDPTAPHFAFIDDPATIPSTASAKRTYFMAKELGKRAARELAAEWPTLFAFDRDQPRLPVFRPENLPDPLQIEPTEKNLLRMIESREVEDCCLLYERMRSENIDVSQKTQLELFKLVAYYNSSNIPFAEWVEWVGMRNFGQNDKAEWKAAGVADLLFETIPRNDETVSIMIAALSKFGENSKAKALFKEHTEAGGKVHIEAYNGLIANSDFKSALDILKDLKTIKPNVSTFSALLESASRIGKFEDRINAFTRIIGEMQALKIEPTLTTYYYILKNIIDSKTQKLLNEAKNDESEKKYHNQIVVSISWLSEILDKIENKQLEVSSNNCNVFFAEAMGVAYRGANLEISQRLLKIYESSNNNVKMPAFTTESLFYNRYLQLFIEQSTSIEQIYQKYKDFVPRLVGVSNSLSGSVYRKLSKEAHWPLLRRVIQDGISAGQMTTAMGEEMRKQLIEVQYHTLSVNERDEFNQLVQKLVSTWIEFSKFTEEYAKRLQRKLSPSQISECALLLTRIGEYQKAFELLELLLDEEASHGEESTVLAHGYARPHVMSALFEDSLRRKDSYAAALCLQIMSLHSNRNKLEPLANRIFEKCSLTESQQKIIQSFIRLRPQ